MRFVRDIRKYYNYMYYAAKAQLKSEVNNAYLDWLWWVLEPFCFMIIYVIIFSVVFNATERYFPVFIFLGNAMWTFFSKCVASSVRLVKNNEITLTKVYIPKYILLIIDMLVNGFKMMISFFIVAIMLLFFQVPISWNILLFVPIMLIFFMFTFGFGTILMHFGVYVEDLNYIITIFLNMMMYFTGIFYSLDRFPGMAGFLLRNLNPVAFLLTSMRKVVMYCQMPDLPFLGVWLFVSIIL